MDGVLENAEAVAVPKMVNILTAWGKFIQSFVEVGENINATELFGNSSMEEELFFLECKI